MTIVLTAKKRLVWDTGKAFKSVLSDSGIRQKDLLKMLDFALIFFALTVRIFSFTTKLCTVKYVFILTGACKNAMS